MDRGRRRNKCQRHRKYFKENLRRNFLHLKRRFLSEYKNYTEHQIDWAEMKDLGIY